MMRIGVGAALAGMIWAGAAMAQDAPPPGCRWQNFAGEQTLACKDGKGNWRRSGDEMVVGTYPMPKPKPKPAPAPVAAPAAKSAEDAGLAAVEEAATVQPEGDEALSAADAGVEAAGAPADEAAPPPAEPARKPWWQAIWDAILNFFRSIGLLK